MPRDVRDRSVGLEALSCYALTLGALCVEDPPDERCPPTRVPRASGASLPRTCSGRRVPVWARSAFSMSLAHGDRPRQGRGVARDARVDLAKYEVLGGSVPWPRHSTLGLVRTGH